MNDLISRQAAIDAIMGEPTDAHYPSWYAERLEQLPPAQPELPDTNVGDPISRQAAIEALKGMAVPLYKDPVCEDIWERDRTLDNAIDAIRGLPSAQPQRMRGKRHDGRKDKTV